jgi:hypothetical protein
MKNFKCLLSRFLLTTFAICLGISSFSQFAGQIDTTFNPNNSGIPFSTSGYYRAVGVEVVGNSVYYAFSGAPNCPKIRKYDFDGNEDLSWYSNQMSTWGTQFATTYLEPEKDINGNYTGEFFVCGRNSFNSMVNQGVRFLNKINDDGTRDLNFVCPYTSWISICSTIYNDWENQKLYYSYRNGYGTVVLVCCDSNTGQVFQTFTIPSVNNNWNINKIIKVPGTEDIIVGGSFNFTLNGNMYNGLFKMDNQFNILPINGVTEFNSSYSIADIIFVNDTECDGTLTGSMKCYVAGGISEISGVTGFKNIARFNIEGNNWTIDQNYNPGCAGSVSDICYYNCHLIATGNFASSSSNGSNVPFWSPKITAFTSEGIVSEEFKLTNIGSGIGGVYTPGFENNFGQGAGRCLAVNPNTDGNDRWEIFVGGSFVNLIQGPWPRNVIKPVNYMAKLHGFNSSIDTKFTYCLDEINNNQYSISTFDISNTLGCEKWELYESDLPTTWNLIRTENTHDFLDTNLVVGKWYKLVRIVTECGNSCSNNYVFYKDFQNCQVQNNGAELRSLVISEQDDNIIRQEEIEALNVNVYPNPSSGMFIIQDQLKNEFRDLSVYNSLGAKVYKKSSTSERYQIDLTDLPSGVYMLVITTDKDVKKTQIIKE